MADAHKVNHDYHIIDPSPWPFIGSIGGLLMAIGGVAYMRWLSDGSFAIGSLELANPWMFFVGLLIVLYTMYAWWADTVKESPCRQSYPCCFHASALWHDPVHCFRGHVLCCLVLGIL